MFSNINVMFEETFRVKNNMFEKGYYNIDSIPYEDLLTFIDKDEYIQRYNTGEKFEIGDKVSFENFTKSGMVNGMGGGMVIVFGEDRREYRIQKDKTFLKSDIIKFGHWNTMSVLARKILLKAARITIDLSEKPWSDINKDIQKLIIKTASPAGFEGHSDETYDTTKPGALNPVSENRSLADRLKEEISQNEKKD